MDANAEFDALIFGTYRIPLRHAALNFHGTARCVDGTCEFDQRTIASPLDYSAAMFRDLGID